MQSVERVRTDSTGSAVSTDDSEQGECPGKQGRSWAAQSWPLGVGICNMVTRKYLRWDGASGEKVPMPPELTAGNTTVIP